ncbi:MAG TPA: DUF6084 family protein [Solirubrobacteraceae bacterium]|nr:DUF6084 family protein [Solirubrobacteraceae bacterium]
MSVEAVGSRTAQRIPAPEFAITGCGHLPFAAGPTLIFSGAATDATGSEIQSIALSVQVMIDPARRGYDSETRERLAELFGPPATWTPSTQGLAWARVSALVPGFTATASFELELPCTYDLEVAAAKYFYALADGFAPLSFHFNGTVFYRDVDARLQVTPVAWSATAQYSLPIATWRAMIAEHYPGGGWIRVSDATLAALNARRGRRGLPSFDMCIEELLSDVG